MACEWSGEAVGTRGCEVQRTANLKSEEGVQVVHEEVPVLHPAASVFDCAEHEAVLVRPAAQRVELRARSARREAPGAQAMEQLSEHMRHEQCGVVH